MFNLNQCDLEMSEYIGRIESLREEFNSILSITAIIADQECQREQFFIVLTLIGLRPAHQPVYDQILASATVPSLENVFAGLLRVSFNIINSKSPSA